MRIGLYVVTEAIEVCGKSMETVSPEEEQGGVFEDGALALQAMLRGVPDEPPAGQADPRHGLRSEGKPIQIAL